MAKTTNICGGSNKPPKPGTLVGPLPGYAIHMFRGECSVCNSIQRVRDEIPPVIGRHTPYTQR